MEDINRLKILHQEEVAARQRWTLLRDRRTELIVSARAQAVPAKDIAEAIGLTTARIYNLVRGKQAKCQAGKSVDLAELARLTRQMEQEEAAATALARQRSEVAQSLVHDGASTPFLAKTLGINVDTFRNWVYGKTDE